MSITLNESSGWWSAGDLMNPGHAYLTVTGSLPAHRYSRLESETKYLSLPEHTLHNLPVTVKFSVAQVVVFLLLPQKVLYSFLTY